PSQTGTQTTRRDDRCVCPLSSRPEKCREMMDKIAREVSEHYTIDYASNRTRDGRWRKLKVAVNSPVNTKYVVHARTGYYHRHYSPLPNLDTDMGIGTKAFQGKSMKGEKAMRRLTRRECLQALGAGAESLAVVGLTGCGTAPWQAGVERREDPSFVPD